MFLLTLFPFVLPNESPQSEIHDHEQPRPVGGKCQIEASSHPDDTCSYSRFVLAMHVPNSRIIAAAGLSGRRRPHLDGRGPVDHHVTRARNRGRGVVISALLAVLSFSERRPLVPAGADFTRVSPFISTFGELATGTRFAPYVWSQAVLGPLRGCLGAFMLLPHGSGGLLHDPRRSPRLRPGINTEFHAGNQWIITSDVRAIAVDASPTGAPC